jgi:hypothetical protein
MPTRWRRCKSSSPKAKRLRASFFRQSDGAIRPYKAFDPVGDVPLRRLFAALAALALISATPASASPGEVRRALPNAEKVGEATYTVLSLRMFNAELFADGGSFSWERPFALTLTYERSAQASLLINRSIREMSSRGAGNAQALAPLRTAIGALLQFRVTRRSLHRRQHGTGNGDILPQRRATLRSALAELPPPLLRHLARRPRWRRGTDQRAIARRELNSARHLRFVADELRQQPLLA